MLVEELLADIRVDVREVGGLFDKFGHMGSFSFLKIYMLRNGKGKALLYFGLVEK